MGTLLAKARKKGSVGEDGGKRERVKWRKERDGDSGREGGEKESGNRRRLS